MPTHISRHRYAAIQIYCPRAIRHVIRSRKKALVQRIRGAGVIAKANIYPYTEADIAAIGEQTSMTERRADDATREVDAWLKCEYLRDKVGEVYPGVVSAVTSFGVFVELQGLYIEGLVHISALPGDYYHFDQPKQRLIGERTRRTFQLGGSVTVQVARWTLMGVRLTWRWLMVSRGPIERRRDEKQRSHGEKRSGHKATSPVVTRLSIAEINPGPKIKRAGRLLRADADE